MTVGALALALPLTSVQASDTDDLLMSLYPEGGSSLFCDSKFTRLNSRIRTTPLYPLSYVRAELDCGTDSQCQSNSRYQLISADLHNLFPMQSSVNLKRRNAEFGDIVEPEQPVPIKRGCALSKSFQDLEPADNLKGDVARVYLYMAHTYKMPIKANFQTMLEWNQLDPPDAKEIERNNRIESLQGTRNVFIDSPAQANALDL